MPIPAPETCQRYPHMRWNNTMTGETFPVACKSWKCPHCAPNLAKFYRWRLGAWAETLDLSRFMTLTLDPSKAWRRGEWKQDVIRKAEKAGLRPHEPGFRQWYSWKYIKKSWNIFLTNLHRRYPGLQYIAIMEPQKNGVMHLHVFVNHYIHHTELVYLWKRSGGGYRCRIGKVRSLKNTAWYVSNYVTKISKIDPQYYPEKARRFTTSRGIMIRYYPKNLNVTKENPVLDREELPWLDCFPDEDFSNCKKCIYKRNCRAQPSEYILTSGGNPVHAPPERLIYMERMAIHRHTKAACDTRYPEHGMVSCRELAPDRRPCRGCLHLTQCRVLIQQPYLPEYYVSHRTGELTKCIPPTQQTTSWNPRNLSNDSQPIAIWKPSKSS